MLQRTWAPPTARLGLSWVRGVATPSQVHALNFYGRCGGVELPTSSSHDSARFFSGAFPPAGAHGLSPQDGFRNRVLALHTQSASKATIPRDPERPKRPASSYFRFAAELREKQGVKSVTEIGQAWKKLDAVQKQPFEQQAASESAVYKRQFEEYKASGKLEAFKRDPAKPVKPLTAYFAWAQEERKAASISKLPVAEAAKALGAGWGALTADKKAPFQAQYQAQMEQYKTKMTAYKDSGAEEKWLAKTGRLEVIKKAEMKKQAEKDKMTDAKLKVKAKEAKAKEKVKAAKEKEKAAVKAKSAKDKAAKANEKVKMEAKRAKDKAALEKKKAHAAVLKQKRVLALDAKKAKAALAKKKVAAALEKKKVDVAAKKKKAKMAADKKKAAAAATKKAASAKAKKATTGKGSNAKVAKSSTEATQV